MATDLLKSNRPSTPGEAERTRAFIKSRERDLANTSQAISEVEPRAKTSHSIIYRLNVALLQLRDALKIQKSASDYLQGAQAGRKSLENNRGQHMENEDASYRPDRDFLPALSDYMVQFNTLTDTLMQIADQSTLRLQELIQATEIELEGWMSPHATITTSLEHLSSTKAHIEEDIRVAKQTIHPMRQVPSELWIEIFGYVIVEDFLFRGRYPNRAMRSTSHTLSHVCRFWRQIVRKPGALWYPISIHPCNVWPRKSYNLFVDAKNNARVPQTIVVNLSQSISWSTNSIDREPVNRPEESIANDDDNGSGQMPSLIRIDTTTLQLKNHTLYIDMREDTEKVAQVLPKIPYGSPSEVILASRRPLRNGNILKPLEYFSSVEFLCIINKAPEYIPPATLSTTLPKLICLALEFKKFPANFQLDGYLTTTLKELYLYDKDGTSHPSPTAGLQLPNLLTLGINYPAQRFFEAIEMKSLDTLILYDYDFPGAAPATGERAISSYSQLTNITFQGWAEPVSEYETYCGAMDAFTRLSRYTPALKSLGFDRSYIPGNALLQHLNQSEEKKGIELSPNLQELVLKCTKGITRDHCDELRKVVANITVVR
ncbi:hypothetical protein FRC19_010099 [Serendipita sp. 401]|nr:hypothetical protein FRC18_002382 [Serendipita sp. 400]KAG8819102.1 hypothetical protein FRC19_010099 [Serendipita sp. 401]KAG9050133.1 hypothetical protein FS842_011400 [Serendipita sp. 407]